MSRFVEIISFPSNNLFKVLFVTLLKGINFDMYKIYHLQIAPHAKFASHNHIRSTPYIYPL